MSISVSGPEVGMLDELLGFKNPNLEKPYLPAQKTIAPPTPPNIPAAPPPAAPPALGGLVPAGVPNIPKPTPQQSVQAGMQEHGTNAKQEGKQQYEEMKPEVTAEPGTPEYGAQKQKELDYEKQHPWGSPISPHPGTWGKIAHVASRIGNIAGNIVAPADMALIPGTDLNKALQAKGNANWIKLGSESELQQAQTENQAAEAWKSLHPEDKAVGTPQESSTGEMFQTFQHPNGTTSTVDLGYKGKPQNITPQQVLGDALTSAIQRGVPQDQLMNDPGVANAVNAIRATQKPGSDQAKELVLPNGTQVAGRSDPQGNLQLKDKNGKWVDAPPGTKLFQQEPYGQFQTQNQERENIAKYTDEYVKAAAARNELGDLIQSGQNADPNQVANSIANLAGGLMVTTAAGVHRINTTEMEAWGGRQGLSWAEEVNKWLDKGAKGAIPPEIANDWQNIVNIYAKRNYAAYLTSVRSAATLGGLEPSVIPVSNEAGNDTLMLSEAGNEAPSGSQKLAPPNMELAPGMKWQHRTVNGKVMWRQTPIGKK